MDAFTSDAVPTHLLTREAYEIYGRQLKPDGVLAINITNRYLDLAPVTAETAKAMGWTGMVIADDGSTESYYTSSTWVILSRNPAFFSHANFQDPNVYALTQKPGFRAWTDDYSNLIQILQ
jgi:hypothetical protein